jgi:hypothetical protein
MNWTREREITQIASVSQRDTVIRDDWLPDVASTAGADTPVFTSAGDGGDDAARGAGDSPEDNIAEIGGNPRRFGNLISGIRRTSTITATSVSV